MKKRVLVSFDEYCPFDCKHCYTYGIERNKYRTLEEIVESISYQDFDVVYVSQKNDNFSDPSRGIELCEALYSKYGCHVFAITRNTFNAEEIRRVKELAENMKAGGKLLAFAISIPAIESASITENIGKVPSPQSRIDFIRRLFEADVPVITMVRPVFPNSIIPTDELLAVIEKSNGFTNCVVSSGLGINDEILARLNLNRQDFSFLEETEYLQGAIDCTIDFIDVKEELCILQSKCRDMALPFFEHSMPALNYLNDSILK